MLDDSGVFEKVRRMGDDSRDVKEEKERTEKERGGEENTEYDSRALEKFSLAFCVLTTES